MDIGIFIIRSEILHAFTKKLNKKNFLDEEN